MQSQILGAFRFLGLIDAAGRPTADLRKLVGDQANRRAEMRKLLERSYACLVKRDLTQMSAEGFDTAMRAYGMSGDTHRKTKTFFLRAARYAELPLSPYILRKTRQRKGDYVGEIFGAADAGDRKLYYVPRISGFADESGPSKTIALENGITLSVRTSADTFKMTAPDRQFVLGLLEKMEKYEGRKPGAGKAGRTGVRG